jgi:hypothetical protein
VTATASSSEPVPHALGPLRTAVRGFLAGVVGVVVFHQGVLALLHAAGALPQAPYQLRPVPPFGVPQVVSAAFWGGVWGVALASLLVGRRGRGYWVAALLFGALAPSLVAWFVVAPLKGLPVAAGGQPSRLLVGLLVNGAWGVGAAVVLALLGRRAGAARPALA